MDSPLYSPELDRLPAQEVHLDSLALNRLITCVCGGIRLPMSNDVETVTFEPDVEAWIMRASDEVVASVFSDFEHYMTTMDLAQFMRFFGSEVARAVMLEELTEWARQRLQSNVHLQLTHGPLSMKLPERLRLPNVHSAQLILEPHRLICTVGSRLRAVVLT